MPILSPQFCPLCGISVPAMPRYPQYVCTTCVQSGTLSMSGEPISFTNKSLFGGFQSVVNGKVGEIHECTINGVRCWADEARFGGIVIQTQSQTQSETSTACQM